MMDKRHTRRWRWVTRDRDVDENLVDDEWVCVWPGAMKPANTAHGVKRGHVDYWPDAHQGHSVDWPADEFERVFGVAIEKGTCIRMVFDGSIRRRS